ncbi:HisA/HisF-related TIM barrel protein [Herbaspirillum robiniae]|uniref:Imidazole glycerol phosphate synthase subunit HisF n=1 Tax=Herbaspirillum robiniae TaxID=2014887 RepID=A0ABX2LYM3_9BURK|nr:HisA/HisF-related TIM barrel protein [Herbaspirillum robiniae]NUU03195.1 hypothetical protein [Herbaspirillum robiniae]
MLKKRLIGVITVKAGWAVQSFGYRRYLPLGRPEVLAENLDRWGADEIIVQCIDRLGDKAGPDLDLLAKLSAIGLSTPLIYAGGIRNEEDGIRVIQGGADRIGLDALLHDAPDQIERLSQKLGAQAIIAAIPLCVDSEGTVQWFDYRNRTTTVLTGRVIDLLRSGTVSEAMIIDHRNEGADKGFDMRLVDELDLGSTPLIAFGGISRAAQMAELLSRPQVVGVAMGNFLSYREHSIRHFKQQLGGAPLRNIS